MVSILTAVKSADSSFKISNQNQFVCLCHSEFLSDWNNQIAFFVWKFGAELELKPVSYES